MSSLFGSSQPAPSLFAQADNKSTQQTTSPFGKTAGTGPFANLSSLLPTQQPTTSLFGNSSAPTSNSAQQLPPSNSLFGTAIPTAQSQEQPTRGGSGLFGNPSNNSTEPQQQQKPLNPPGSLFGGLSASGAQQTQPKAGLGTSSLFNTTPSFATQSQHVPHDGQQAQRSVMPSSAPTALFQNLLERGRKRNAESNPNLQFGDLPNLQLGLSDISSKVRNLGGSYGFSKIGRGTDSKTHYLLAASGVPRASTLQDLNDFPAHAESPVNGLVPTSLDTDIDSYVSQLQAKSNADLFREHMEQTKRDFDAFVEEHFHMNLDEQRQRVYEHFGLAKASKGMTETPYDNASPPKSSFRGSLRRAKFPGDVLPQASFGASSMKTSVLGGTMGKGRSRIALFSDISERASQSVTASAQEDSVLQDKQDKYGECVAALNLARLHGKQYDIIDEFAKVEIGTGNDTPPHLVDGYKVLKEIIKEHKQPQSATNGNIVRERQYAKDYLGKGSLGTSAALRKQMLIGSKTYLEKSFLKSVEDLVTSNPHEASIGGIPSKINKVRGYIRIRLSRKDLGPENDSIQSLGSDPCWVLVFYLLRGGLVEEAAQYVAENDRAFKSMDRQFPQYMAAYASDPDRRLPRYLQQKIEGEYASKLAELTTDPYRLACLKIIGRCNLGAKHLEGVNTGMEDWMWVVLSLTREVPRTDETAGESFNLEDAQSLVDTIGLRHFQNGDDTATGYATFFFLQMLVGMFEKAVAWLQSYNYIAATHFAIVLDYYGLLRTSNFDPAGTRLLSFTAAQQPQISFARLLGYYTRGFRTVKPEVAVDYLTLIALNADLRELGGQSQVSICHEAFKELVLETREFATLLGDMRSDGQQTMGAIERRLPLIKPADEGEFLRTLILQAAALADDVGRVTDAALLYHLAGEYDNVTSVINQALSEAILVELGRQGMRLQPLKPRRNNDSEERGMEQNHLTSLSLTSVDDPADLAKKMTALYNSDALYYHKIQQKNRDACGLLIRMSEIRGKVEKEKWGEALGMIDRLRVVPLEAGGNISLVRLASQSFNALPQVVARTVGTVLLWTVRCLGQERARIQDSTFQTQRSVADELLVKAKDMMVFAGLIRYKLPPDVFEVLARSGQEIETK